MIRGFLLMALAAASYGSTPPVAVHGSEFLVDGSPFEVKGIHYGPWRPGTGPNKGYPYPAEDAVDSDLRMIRDLNANTILVVDPPEYVLDIAARYRLKVIYSFYLDWWNLGRDLDKTSAQIVRAASRMRGKPALLAWSLGNEVPPALIGERGQQSIERALGDLYRQIKKADPLHPVTHSNWPVTKDLDLGFLDFVSFNVYPLWPPEVVAQGYEAYIRDRLQPLAHGRPMLISEFGANSLEAGEAGESRLLLQCWKDLHSAGAFGGIVFEFADEWWKNYDNPRREGAWWDRKSAPDDEKTHDRDPEEYYGIFTAERHPKPAARTVREMFAGGGENRRISRTVPAFLIGTLLLVAIGGWIGGRRQVSGKSRRPSADPQPR